MSSSQSAPVSVHGSVGGFAPGGPSLAASSGGGVGSGGGAAGNASGPNGPMIVDVWNYNLEAEMRALSERVEEYPYVGMDTEFPGVVARPVQSQAPDYHFQTVKCNCDLLKVIQIGVSVFNERGERPPGTCTWQFNFHFSLDDDMYAQDSINLLSTSGIDFAAHKARGIKPEHFAELLMTSGLVLMDNVRWIVFHGGYDFGYLLALLTARALPHDEANFFDQLALYFPNFYDIKYMAKSCERLSGGLAKVATTLGAERLGTEHQAGSDSLLTAEVFFRMRSEYFEDEIDDSKFCGVLYSLGKYVKQKSSRKQPVRTG